MSDGSQGNLRDIRVLLVDDDSACRQFLAVGLQMEGVIVTQASSAEEAMEVLKDHYFDAITTDMNLPREDGLTLLRYIRNNLGDLPVILITGFSSVRSAVDALKLGAQDYLPKPIESVDRLLGSIWRAVDHYRVTIQNKALHERVLRAEKLESLASIAGGVAHDLNNILSPMVSLPDLITEELTAFEEKSGCSTAEIREDIELMKASGQRAAAVVKDMMTSSRRANYEKKILDLNILLSNCVASQEIREMMEDVPEISIETEFDEADCVINGSEPHISRAVSNVFRNAMEAMDERITGLKGRDGKLRVSSKRVFLNQPIVGYDVIEEGDYVRVRVLDSGVGIEKDIVDRIFEPFFSTKKETRRSGSGLGLAVVHGIMKDHGGFVDIGARKEGGTRFDLYFPASTDKVAANEPSVVLKGGNESILVVDDEPAQRRVAHRMLKKLGYSVTEVCCGRDAVAVFKEKSAKGEGSPFDLVILDMIMEEDFDGLVTFQAIRKIYPQQRAIIASGFAPTGRVQAAVEKGAGWLAKPYSMEKLAMSVRDKLD